MAAGVGNGGKDGGKQQGVWDGHVHTAIFKTDKQQGPTAHRTAQCYMAGWMGGEFRENRYLYMYGRVSLHSPETITPLLTGYTSIQNFKNLI